MIKHLQEVLELRQSRYTTFPVCSTRSIYNIYAVSIVHTTRTYALHGWTSFVVCSLLYALTRHPAVRIHTHTGLLKSQVFRLTPNRLCHCHKQHSVVKWRLAVLFSIWNIRWVLSTFQQSWSLYKYKTQFVRRLGSESRVSHVVIKCYGWITMAHQWTFHLMYIVIKFTGNKCQECKWSFLLTIFSDQTVIKCPETYLIFTNCRVSISLS